MFTRDSSYLLCLLFSRVLRPELILCQTEALIWTLFSNATNFLLGFIIQFILQSFIIQVKEQHNWRADVEGLQ